MSSRDKFQSAKAAQGYVGALERPRCDTCRHSVDCYGSTQQCRLGGFLVTRRMLEMFRKKEKKVAPKAAEGEQA